MELIRHIPKAELHIYIEGSLEPERAYLQRCADQNVRHTEIFFDPQAHTDRGICFLYRSWRLLFRRLAAS